MNESVVKASVSIYAACTRASIKVLAMQTRNTQCMIKHKEPIYTEADFLKVIEEEGIGENDVMSMLFTH